MNLQELPDSGNSVEPANEDFEALDWASVYAKDATTTTGLTWGYLGGRWAGFAITAATLTLTDASTNYVVVQRSDGVISTSTTSTNWDNTTDYARVYKLTTAGGVVTATEDHRAGLYGVHGFTLITSSAPTLGWYSPSADLIRTPNSVTIDDQLAVSGSGNNSLAGTMEFTGTGPHAFGGTRNARMGMRLNLNATASGTVGGLVVIGGTVTAAANNDELSHIAEWNDANVFAKGAFTGLTVAGMRWEPAEWSVTGTGTIGIAVIADFKSVPTIGTTNAIFRFPTDNTDPTAGGGAATGRIPIVIAGAIRYIPYY